MFVPHATHFCRYRLGDFAVQLNYCPNELRDLLPRTDSRLRLELRCLDEGQIHEVRSDHLLSTSSTRVRYQKLVLLPPPADSKEFASIQAERIQKLLMVQQANGKELHGSATSHSWFVARIEPVQTCIAGRQLKYR